MWSSVGILMPCDIRRLGARSRKEDFITRSTGCMGIAYSRIQTVCSVVSESHMFNGYVHVGRHQVFQCIVSVVVEAPTVRTDLWMDCVLSAFPQLFRRSAGEQQKRGLNARHFILKSSTHWRIFDTTVVHSAMSPSTTLLSPVAFDQGWEIVVKTFIFHLSHELE